MLPNPRAHPDHPGDREFLDHLMRDEYGYEQCPHCLRWGHPSEMEQHIGREHPDSDAVGMAGDQAAQRGEGDPPSS